MNDLLKEFERHERVHAQSEKSIVSYTSKIKEFFSWLKNKDSCKGIAQVTREDIEEYLEWCFYKGNANMTRASKLIALRKFFQFAVYKYIISEDPTAMVPRIRLWRKFVQKFTKEEVLRLFQAIDINKEKGLRDAVILVFAVFCGLRLNEILSVNMNDISESYSLEINVKGKMHSDRSVYLWKEPSVLVMRYFAVRISQGAKGTDPFFVSYRHQRPTGRRLLAAAVHDLLRRIAKKAGIRKAEIYPHMFRATHISDLRSIRGYDLAAIAERVGHRSISTTDRYIPRRERIHRTYNSLHEYWREFAGIWDERRDSDNPGDL